MDEQGRLVIAEVEALILRLPGIEGCRVVISDLGVIEEIHVLAQASRAAKQVVRDIESALAATWDIRIDHKRVSVAQLKQDDNQGDRLPSLAVQSYRMDLQSAEGVMAAGVRLLVNDNPEQVLEGSFTGRYLPSQQLQAMAAATVDAINQLPALPTLLVLRDVLVETLAGQSAAVVALSYVNTRQREDLAIGVAISVGDLHRAAADACVDAFERGIRARVHPALPAS